MESPQGLPFRGLAPGPLLIAVALVAGLATGCVTKGSYEEMVAERDALQQERAALAEEKRSVEQERDLLEARAAALDEQVAAARLSEEESARQLAESKETYASLVDELEEELAAGSVQIEQLKDGITLNVSQDVLFPTGSSTLDEGGLDVVERVSGKILETSYRVEVEGHTDNVPIGPALQRRYPSNWELAGARAASVVRILEDKGIGGSRLVAVSYGDNAPLAPNDSKEGRQMNRRIEIRLLPIPPEERLPSIASPPPSGAPAGEAAKP